MDSWALLGLMALGWLVILPVLGSIAFSRTGRLSQEIKQLRDQISGLQGQAPSKKDERAPVPTPQPDAQPSQSMAPARTAASPQLSQDSLAHAAGPSKRRAKQPLPPEAPRSAPRTLIDWERMIAANWMVWAGGLALAIGGLFLVRIAIDAGFFGPMVRTIFAGLLGAGLIAAAFRAESIKLVTEAKAQIRHLPSILAGAGIISLYGACLGAGLIYGFIPPLLALGLSAIVSTLAVALSLKYGSALAAIGLGGAYGAPLLTGAETGSALPLLPYIAVITSAGLILVRLMGWRVLSWLTLCGTAFWGLITVGGSEAAITWAVPAFGIVTSLISLFLAEPQARAPISLDANSYKPKSLLTSLGKSLTVAHFFWSLAGGFIVLTGLQHENAPETAAALALFGGLGLLAGWRREGFALLTPIAALTTLGALLIWPDISGGLGFACLASGAGFGLAGSAILTRLQVKAPVAASAALMPPATLFIAFWREGNLEPDFFWGLVALTIACLLGIMLGVLRQRDPDFKSHPGAASAYALGAILSATLAPFLVLSGLWLGSAMAVVALAVILVLGRFDLPLIRWAGPVTVALTTALLIRPGMLSDVDISPLPILNELTAGFGLAIAALASGAWLARTRPRLTRTYQAGAMILGFSLVGLTIRHIAGGGTLYGPFNGMGESSAYSIAYLGLAASLAWRFRKNHWFWRLAEAVAALIGVAGIVTAFSAIGSEDVGGLPIANLLLPAFAMPAFVLAGYASVLRKAERGQAASFIGAGSMLLGFFWVSAETARAVGGPMLHDWTNDAIWAYSPAWITYAFLLLFWGIWKSRPSARFASLTVLLLAIAKVFLIDMGSLEGVARAGSFIGLGTALIGIALFYQRYVFAMDKREQPENQTGSGLSS